MPKGLSKRSCRVCHAEYIGASSQLLCRACKKESEKKICPVCGKDFFTISKTCSPKCGMNTPEAKANSSKAAKERVRKNPQMQLDHARLARAVKAKLGKKPIWSEAARAKAATEMKAKADLAKLECRKWGKGGWNKNLTHTQEHRQNQRNGQLKAIQEGRFNPQKNAH